MMTIVDIFIFRLTFASTLGFGTMNKDSNNADIGSITANLIPQANPNIPPSNPIIGMPMAVPKVKKSSKKPAPIQRSKGRRSSIRRAVIEGQTRAWLIAKRAIQATTITAMEFTVKRKSPTETIIYPHINGIFLPMMSDILPMG